MSDGDLEEIRDRLPAALREPQQHLYQYVVCLSPTGPASGNGELMQRPGDDGMVVGFMATSCRPSLLRGGRKLRMLFVDAAFMGRGVGRALVGYATGTLGVTYVDVHRDNVRGVCFYRRAGFCHIIGCRLVDTMGHSCPLLTLSMRMPSPLWTWFVFDGSRGAVGEEGSLVCMPHASSTI
jgi:GNAT superfamily N-acetyltransferase